MQFGTSATRPRGPDLSAAALSTASEGKAALACQHILGVCAETQLLRIGPAPFAEGSGQIV
jgi:hypothetical protein